VIVKKKAPRRKEPEPEPETIKTDNKIRVNFF
jgi:hypothetical protein